MTTPNVVHRSTEDAPRDARSARVAQAYVGKAWGNLSSSGRRGRLRCSAGTRSLRVSTIDLVSQTIYLPSQPAQALGDHLDEGVERDPRVDRDGTQPIDTSLKHAQRFCRIGIAGDECGDEPRALTEKRWRVPLCQSFPRVEVKRLFPRPLTRECSRRHLLAINGNGANLNAEPRHWTEDPGELDSHDAFA